MTDMNEIEPMETEVSAGDKNSYDMVPSSRTSTPEARIPLFSGEKGTIAINEWLHKFEAIAKANGWSIGVQKDKLPGLTTGRAFSVLQKLLTQDLGPEDILDLYRSTLQKTFGLTAEKAFQALCARTFDVSKEDIDSYASDIVNNVDTAFERWTAMSKDALSVKFFWRGLPNSSVSKQLLRRLPRLH